MSATAAQQLFDTIQQMEREGKIFNEGEPQGLLRSFVCIAEFIGDDGDRWVAQISLGMDGKVPPEWETIGLLEATSHYRKHRWATE